LPVFWSWGNEMNNPLMAELAKNVIHDYIHAGYFEPQYCAYGATMKKQNFNHGEYEGNAGVLDILKGDAGAVFGDHAKLAIWKEVHDAGDGAGWKEPGSTLHQALYWWARPRNNGIRIWLSDDGVFEGDSECDYEVSTGHRRPSAKRWGEIIKACKQYANDFIFEHLPKGGDVKCQANTIRAMYRAAFGKEPEAKYQYVIESPPIPTPEPGPEPEPAEKPSCWHWLSKLDFRRFFNCLLGKL